MRRFLTSVGNEPDEDEINVTPMLDVVFILLIFFIVTSSFVRESGIEVDTPRASSAATLDTTAIIVGISPVGEFWIDGKLVDRRALRTAIARLHAANPQGGLLIQADTRTAAGDIVAAMDAARRAGVKQVALAATEP